MKASLKEEEEEGGGRKKEGEEVEKEKEGEDLVNKETLVFPFLAYFSKFSH